MSLVDLLLGLMVKVESSTTESDSVDEVETGWAQPHVGGQERTMETKTTTCQGEGRGFESVFRSKRP